MRTQAPVRRVSIHDLRQHKERGERFAMLTAYDYPTALALDEAGIDVLLVGDTLGMVVLGYDATVPVTVDDVIHHLRPVVRGAQRALVVGDLPFGSYQVSTDDGMRSAVRLLKEGGAQAVKAEGAGPVVDLTARLVQAGVPVMAHLGLTPQSVNQLGGFRVQARDAEAADRLADDAKSLEQAGAFALVLEAVPAELGRLVTTALGIPVIGIGAGPHTDAQVLVSSDMLGLTPGRLPRFVKPYADLRGTITGAARAFRAEVASGAYPDADHSYT